MNRIFNSSSLTINTIIMKQLIKQFASYRILLTGLSIFFLTACQKCWDIQHGFHCWVHRRIRNIRLPMQFYQLQLLTFLVIFLVIVIVLLTTRMIIWALHQEALIHFVQLAKMQAIRDYMPVFIINLRLMQD